MKYLPQQTIRYEKESKIREIEKDNCLVFLREDGEEEMKIFKTIAEVDDFVIELGQVYKKEGFHLLTEKPKLYHYVNIYRFESKVVFVPQGQLENREYNGQHFPIEPLLCVDEKENIKETFLEAFNHCALFKTRPYFEKDNIYKLLKTSADIYIDKCVFNEDKEGYRIVPIIIDTWKSEKATRSKQLDEDVDKSIIKCLDISKESNPNIIKYTNKNTGSNGNSLSTEVLKEFERLDFELREPTGDTIINQFLVPKPIQLILKMQYPEGTYQLDKDKYCHYWAWDFKFAFGHFDSEIGNKGEKFLVSFGYACEDCYLFLIDLNSVNPSNPYIYIKNLHDSPIDDIGKGILLSTFLKHLDKIE